MLSIFFLNVSIAFSALDFIPPLFIQRNKTKFWNLTSYPANFEIYYLSIPY